MKTHFTAELSAYDENGSGEESAPEEVVVVELVALDKGQVLLGFNDRNERVYLQFCPQDLLAAIMAMTAE